MAELSDLTPEEREAEAIFRLALHRRLCAREACIMARELAKRSPEAGAYLAWLLQRHRDVLRALGNSTPL